MSDSEKKELKSIADYLTGTLGTMSSGDADKQVANQIARIYQLLGYEVQSFALTTSNIDLQNVAFKEIDNV